MLIHQRAVEDYQRRKFDNWLWAKKLTEEVLLRELSLMRHRPLFKTKPWLHQLVMFFLCLHNPKFLLLLDMGLGKSKIILDLITQARRERRLQRALVLVPRVINIDSWKDDIARHSNLEATLIDCKDIEEKWERLSNPKGDVTVMDYPSMHWALSKKKRGKKKGTFVLTPDESRVATIKKLYNFMNLDEIHKLGNHESLWFMLLRRLTADMDYTYGTTGTLFAKDPMVIWPQFYLIDRGDTFGENLGLFRASFFTALPNQFGRGEKFKHDPAKDELLHKMINHRSLRYDESEVMELPERVARVKQYHMGDEQYQHYMNALDGLIQAYGDRQELLSQYTKLRQIVSGYLAWKDDSGDHIIRFKDNPKLDGLEGLIEDMGDRNKCVIPYHYTETGRMLCERIAKMGIGYEWFYGGTKDKSASKERFEQDPKCRVMVMNTVAGGTGNDGLQKVARYMFIYETPTSPTDRKQVIKRIHRPGQHMRSFIYDLVMRRSLDTGILRDILEANDTYESVVNGRRRPGKGFFLQDWDFGHTPPD